MTRLKPTAASPEGPSDRDALVRRGPRRRGMAAGRHGKSAGAIAVRPRAARRDRVTRRTALRLLPAAPLTTIGGCCTTVAFDRGGRGPPAVPGAHPLPGPARATGAAIAGSGPQSATAKHISSAPRTCRGGVSSPSASPTVHRNRCRPCSGLWHDWPKVWPPRPRPRREEIRDLGMSFGEGAAVSVESVATRRRREQAEAAQRLTDTIRNSEFERLYRQMKQSERPAAPTPRRTGSLSRDEILRTVADAERPSLPPLRPLPHNPPSETARLPAECSGSGTTWCRRGGQTCSRTWLPSRRRRTRSASTRCSARQLRLLARLPAALRAGRSGAAASTALQIAPDVFPAGRPLLPSDRRLQPVDRHRTG